jgi:hypothetical protein
VTYFHEQAAALIERANALSLVNRERDLQDRTWGQQDHPELPPRVTRDLREVYRDRARYYQEENAYRVRAGTLAWDGILLEEAYEALSEGDAEKREAELVQVAAVAVAMVEASRRKRLKPYIQESRRNVEIVLHASEIHLDAMQALRERQAVAAERRL